jgi:hypothetical protein
MLNWLFDNLEAHGVLDDAHISGIASCFCCASDEERQKIQSKGKVVPIKAVVDYHGAKVDVITPRDLLFDGFVVDIEGEKTRLPGIFMDVKSRFKIEAEYELNFRKDVLKANLDFCTKVKKHFGIDLQIGWFAVSKAICHVMKVEPNMPMGYLMENMLDTLEHRGQTQVAQLSLPVNGKRKKYYS